ncbi:uncharacterized protein LOC122849846 [Aphidius gifuensis]|uniref:uncharacterized protein LOC122849846 n=1 Tax=Aphidius gifuensis TaxID=684658 RepID=UPI001CDB5199|nr:uncharacterized protein LOC122849846 [Aphidius gifuensis]
MLGLVRQPLLKSVRIAQLGVKKFAQPNPRAILQRSCSSIFSVGVKKFAQPIPRVLQRSYGSYVEPRSVSKEVFIIIIDTLQNICLIVILYYLYRYCKLIDKELQNEQNSTEKNDTSP